jgi:predicted neuraminidase
MRKMKWTVEKHELVFDGQPPFKSCHASTVALLQDGSVFCSWFGGSREGAGDVKIWGALKRKGVWQPPRMLAGQEGTPHWNPVALCRKDGSLLLFYKVGKIIASWQTYFIVSHDNGETWTQPQELVPGDFGGRGPVRAKAIWLSSGRLLAPGSLEEGGWRSFVDRSDDEGLTWIKSNEVYARLRPIKNASPVISDIPVSDQSFHGRGVIQPTIWESAEGVHMMMRSSEGYIYRSDSYDAGESWCEAYPTQLPNNNSGIDVVRACDGLLYLLCNPVGVNWGPRSPLCLLCSADNGNSWRQMMAMETGTGEFSYPAIISEGDRLLITYTWRRERIAFWEMRL